MNKIFASFPFLFLLACGGGGLGSGPVSEADAEEYCNMGCTHDEECGNLEVGETVESCTTECVDAVSGVYRGDALQSIAECVSGLECTANDDMCFEQIDPLGVHEDWEARCREVMPTLCQLPATEVDGYCEVTPDASSDNSGFISVLAAPIVEDLTACFDEATCEALQTCQQAVFEQYGIGI